jgi:hypothetical protein
MNSVRVAMLAAMAPFPVTVDNQGTAGGTTKAPEDPNPEAEVHLPPVNRLQAPERTGDAMRQLGSIAGSQGTEHVPFTTKSSVKRPQLNIARLSIVLSKGTCWVPGPNPDDEPEEMDFASILNIRPVQTGGNFEIGPFLAQGTSTPYARLPDWQKIDVLKATAQLLDEHGYGFPEEVIDGKLFRAQSVWETFRMATRGTGGPRPRLYVNAERFSPEDARTVAQARRVMAEGTPEQRQALKNSVKEIQRTEEAVESDVEL